MNKVRYGLVGYGNMGSVHADSLFSNKIDNGELVAVCDTDKLKLKNAKEKFHDKVKYYENYEEIVKDNFVDAIIIATPHFSHPQIAILSFKHNKHVLIEKPAGVYTKQVKEMNEEALKHPELTFGIMFNQRTNPIYQKAKEIVSSGELGEIRRTNWLITNWYRPQAYYNSGGWRATWDGEGGGVLLNQSPHQLDLWQWICGMPEKVTAYCEFGKFRDVEVENDVTAFATYPNKATGIFITSTHEYPGTNRFEISGDKGQIIIENDQLIYNQLKVSERVFNQENKEPWSNPGYERIEFNANNRWGMQHNEIIRNFTNAIVHNTPLIAPGIEGINELTISNAMLLSTFINQTIELQSMDEALFLDELQKRMKMSKQ